MPANIKSAAIQGIDAVKVSVEVDVLKGLPSFTLVGLGDTAIKESRERLTAALSHIGYTPPRRKTIVSLAPASLKKEGSLYDLPIALAFLMASKQVDVKGMGDTVWMAGELGLDATVRPVLGVLPMALAAERQGVKELFVPADNSQEAAAVADRIKVYAVKNLKELVRHLEGEKKLNPIKPGKFEGHFKELAVDMADIKGHEHAKRALMVAAAAAHNVLMVGPPGSGKTLLARALAGILPPLTREESYEVTSLYSVAGLLDATQGLITQRPFRSPHHGASSVALVGGGTGPKPGEVSLAHNGVLFLDELPEFSRHMLDQLRQPIEDGFITVARAAHTIKYPAQMILAGAMNPCKCGYLGSSRRECACAPGDMARYQRKISGPLLDRFDIHLVINDIPMEDLLESDSAKQELGPSSEDAAKMTAAARALQLQRQGKPNAYLDAKEIKRCCVIDDLSQKMLIKAQERFYISSRGVHRILKTARTIADLEAREKIQMQHIAEALQYREQLKGMMAEGV